MGSVEFLDKGFKKSVRSALEIQNEILTEADITRITGIVITDSPTKAIPIPWLLDGTAYNMHQPNLFFDVSKSENGQWVVDLQQFNHLKSLYFLAPVRDLGYLRSFYQLRDLNVAAGSSCEDWSFLADLVHLKFLWIDEAPYFNMGVLGALAVNQSELAEKTRNSSTRPSRLTYLNLNNCGLRDISPLANFSELVEVDLSNNRISDFSSLLDLPLLYGLSLPNNKLSDLSFISRESPHLYYLNLCNNNISDVAPLKHLSSLSKLFIRNNPIQDQSPLKHMRLVRLDTRA